MAEYRVTFKNGGVREAHAWCADSLVLLLGGTEAMLLTVAKVEVNSRHGEWDDSAILTNTAPTAFWADDIVKQNWEVR